MLNYLRDFLINFSSVYIALATFILYTVYQVVNNRRLPPGPFGLPYIGYWPFFSHENCHIELYELAKKYGDVFSFTVTGRTLIHLGSYKAAKEAHIIKADCFAERFTCYNILQSYHKDGVPFIETESWKIMRKFFLQQFNELGMNVIKEAHSGAIYGIIRETVSDLGKLTGVPVDITDMIFKKSNKIMQLTLLGQDGMSEEELLEFCFHYNAILLSMTSKNVMLFGKIAQYFIMPFCFYANEGRKNHLLVQDILYKMIDRRKATYKESHIRDVVDAYFKERADRKSKNDPMYKSFTDKCLMASLVQILGDGILFMGMFVSSFIKALVIYPGEQEKIYQELMEVCGMDRDPELDDKNNLTYTNAFISEVIRTTDVFTVFPTTICTKDTTLCGHRVPKGAITLYNFYSAHLDEREYEEPGNFNPSRFLVEESKRPELLTHFGLGRRSCIGKAFAMHQVFLFLTTLVKNFRFSLPPGVKSRRTLYFASDKMDLIVEPRSDASK